MKFSSFHIKMFRLQLNRPLRVCLQLEVYPGQVLRGSPHYRRPLKTQRNPSGGGNVSAPAAVPPPPSQRRRLPRPAGGRARPLPRAQGLAPAVPPRSLPGGEGAAREGRYLLGAACSMPLLAPRLRCPEGAPGRAPGHHRAGNH